MGQQQPQHQRDHCDADTWPCEVAGERHDADVHRGQLSSEDNGPSPPQPLGVEVERDRCTRPSTMHHGLGRRQRTAGPPLRRPASAEAGDCRRPTCGSRDQSGAQGEAEQLGWRARELVRRGSPKGKARRGEPRQIGRERCRSLDGNAVAVAHEDEHEHVTASERRADLVGRLAPAGIGDDVRYIVERVR